MDEKTKKVLFHLIDSKTKGVDTYHHNGSMWLIFTDQKKWVIELSKDGTLWYNHYFFKDCFKYLSLDVVENQHYITEWVEDIIQNGVRSTDSWAGKPFVSVESIIQNGVINTAHLPFLLRHPVESIIQNGVKETNPHHLMGDLTIEEVIQNGVKETKKIEHDRTTYHGYFNQERGSHTPLDTVQNVIENGIKETWGYERQPQTRINDVIQTGKKFDTQ